MPTADEHKRKAEHDLRFLETIDTDEFCDWMAVVAFYIAVHLVEQLRALVDEHSTDHTNRLEFIRAHHPSIHFHFHALYNISRIARYGAGPHLWLRPEFVSGCLAEIQQYVRDASAPPAP